MIIKKNQSENVIRKNPTEKTNVQKPENTVPSKAVDEKSAPLNFEDIIFDARQERRQGSRRRGYRRVDDRNIVSRAQDEAKSIREQAVKEGHKIGIENAAEDIQALNDAIVEFFNYKEEIFDNIAPHILEIAVQIAKKIINTEIKQDKNALISLIKTALGDTFKLENRITVKVMPQDVATVRENLPEALSADSIEASIKVIPDENIQSGGAIIITDNGIIDATIDTGLSILELAFKKIQEKQESDEQ